MSKKLKSRAWEKFFLIGIILILIAFGAFLYVLKVIKDVHTQILSVSKSRQFEDTESFDGSYCMHVDVEENIQDKVSYVNVIIYNEISEEVYKIENEYRAFDFHWVTWERESNSFWIKSGDLGTFYYEFQEGDGWEKYSLIKRNDKYFLSKGYGEGEIKKEIKQEEMLKRIPENFKL